MSRQENDLKRTLDAGDVAVGASAVTFSAAVIEVYGDVGLDYAFLDFEHNGAAVWDSLDFEELTRVAEVADLELVVRLPSGEAGDHPPVVRKVLDTGIRNVVVPRVETAAEVRSAVEAARFEYEGRPGERGVGAARGSSWGADIDHDWLDGEDENVLCGIMVENETAVANLEDILAVPDLGFVFVGSNDLSVSLGCPLDFEHPDFREALAEIRDACVAAGVPFGQLGADLDAGSAMVDRGGQLLSVGSDLGAVRETVAERRRGLDR